VGLVELVPPINGPPPHPDDVKIARKLGKPLFSGRIKILRGKKIKKHGK
jgi:hypothetical protein